MTKPTTVSYFFNQSLNADTSLTAKQRQIILAALDLFAENGFEKATTAEIAARAGVAEGTVYKRYKTKRELLNTILNRFASDVVPQAAQEFATDEWTKADATLHAFLTALVSNRIEFIADNYQIIKIIASEALNNAEMQQQVLGNIGSRLFGELSKHIDRLKAKGEIVDWPNDILMQFVVGTMASLAVRLFVQLPPTDLADQTQHMVAFLEKGLTPAK
ncbi:TetR/AcrR family transcriptional regulator [Lacticaseibacillus hulanensis]|jgi:AcrR family transcriptional regulator|uniref:TetR/AcrR family transcriptional regulator n=1 Tax=Lacticaseibacillus hulanensis TaxID=2493111 RepID=UPI0013E3F24F|nr:TetR/AcrR family transcriptional regulator [Lacticaseibacillus hulanensis]